MRLQKGLNSNCDFTKLAINETSEWSQRELRILMQKKKKMQETAKIGNFQLKIVNVVATISSWTGIPLQEARLADFFFILFVSRRFYLS